MAETPRHDISRLRRLARTPRFVGAAAIALLLVSVVAIVLSFMLTERPSGFRMKSFPTKLSDDVVAVVEGYERQGIYGNGARYLIKADRATTFADNHQELENVYMEVYGEEGDRFDRMTSRRAVYLPGAESAFKIFLSGEVDITTKDSLKVRTGEMSYERSGELIESEDRLEFEREEIKGTAVGARLAVKDQRLELFSDVVLAGFAKAQGDLSANKIESFKATAASASADLLKGELRFSGSAKATVNPFSDGQGPTAVSHLKADRIEAFLEEKEVSRIVLDGSVDIERTAGPRSPRWLKATAQRATAHVAGEVTRIEMEGSAEVRSGEGRSGTSIVNAQSLDYDVASDAFKLAGDVRIVTDETTRPVSVKSGRATYERAAGRIDMWEGAEITTATESLTAERMAAKLRGDQSVASAHAKGLAKLLQRSSDRATEVTGGEIEASFDEGRNLEFASAKANPSVTLLPSKPEAYGKVRLSAPSLVRARFHPGGAIREVTTTGRTSVEVTAPEGVQGAFDRTLIADTVQSFFSADGKSLVKAEAVGRAELSVDPRSTASDEYRTRISAPRFECLFGETENSLRSCSAGTKTRTVRSKVVPRPGDGEQVLTADSLSAEFRADTRDVDWLEAQGAARFAEQDRTGTAARIRYAAGAGLVQLRGGQPLVWDSRSRARAQEIDIKAGTKDVLMRGSVSATYHGQGDGVGDTMFSSQRSPVYVTSDAGEFISATDLGVFSGSVRMWQGRNFIKASKIEMYRRERRIVAGGGVESLLFDSRRTQTEAGVQVPVLGFSETLLYDSPRRTVVYQGKAQLRQGSDVIIGDKLTAVLGNQNEILRAIAEGGVAFNQPGRRASGDFAEYDVQADTVVLRGSPAKIFDSDTGTSESAAVTLNLKDRRVESRGGDGTASGRRTRTVYKVKELNRER